MNCAEFESQLTDYVDGKLGHPERAALEQHAQACVACREFMRDVTGAVAFLKRIKPVEPRPELVTRIAYQTPQGRARGPLDRPGWLSRLTNSWLRPILQPRFVMGMAMTILSFSMLERCTGFRVQRIQAADLSPVHVWENLEDKIIRVKDRAVKNYQNVRLVYEIETRIKDLEAQQEASQKRGRQAASPQARIAQRHGEAEPGTATPNEKDNKK